MTERSTALIIGGTGPTGPHVVAGLLARGIRVTILHTGRHEHPDMSTTVEHIHTDPFDAAAVSGALANRHFAVGIIMYGRLRDLTAVVSSRVERLISVGGMPALLGYGDPEALAPHGLPVPASEHERLANTAEGVANTKAIHIADTEHAVFATNPSTTHLRYPLVYGPHQLIPREWTIVRRALDGRPRIIAPDGGLQLRSAVYSANAAHALLAVVDHPETTAGKIFHVSDAETPSVRQIIEIIADALGHSFEIISLPDELATPARPMMMLSGSYHRYTPATALAHAIDYKAAVPAADGLAATARWLADHRPPPGGQVERTLQDPFNYPAEDALITCWNEAFGPLRAAANNADPFYVDRYSPRYDELLTARRSRRSKALTPNDATSSR